MNIKKLFEAYMRLKTITVLSDFTFSDIGETLSRVLEMAFYGDETDDGSNLLQEYSLLCTLIYENGGNLSEIIRDYIRSGENLYVDKYIRGEVSEELENSLSADLDTLQLVAKIKSDDIIPLLKPYVTDIKSLTIPKWETSTVNIRRDFASTIKGLGTLGYGVFAESPMLKIKDDIITPVKNPDYQDMDELFGYDRERALVLKNTEAFAKGNPASNVLLYGDAGTGKSTTVKACAGYYWKKGVRLIEFSKSQISLIPEIAEELSDSPLKFIFFIDDLTFKDNDDSYYALKGILEGNVSKALNNILIYATSNRRHLIKESLADRDGDDIHLNDTLQEMTSLSARFGLTVTFSKPDKESFLELVESLALEKGLPDGIVPGTEKYDAYMSDLLARAEAFAIRSNGRSPRTAKQFMVMSDNGLF